MLFGSLLRHLLPIYNTNEKSKQLIYTWYTHLLRICASHNIRDNTSVEEYA